MRGANHNQSIYMSEFVTQCEKAPKRPTRLRTVQVKERDEPLNAHESERTEPDPHRKKAGKALKEAPQTGSQTNADGNDGW